MQTIPPVEHLFVCFFLQVKMRKIHLLKKKKIPLTHCLSTKYSSRVGSERF